MKRTLKLVTKYNYYLIFLVGITATLGSLYYSEIANYTPCLLCWYQRIFMYPIPIITLIGITAKYKNLRNYILGLATPGLIIACYHVYVQAAQVDTNLFGSCSTASPCQEIQYAFGGILTIAVQSMLAFTLIMGLLLVNYYLNKK